MITDYKVEELFPNTPGLQTYFYRVTHNLSEAIAFTDGYRTYWLSDGLELKEDEEKRLHGYLRSQEAQWLYEKLQKEKQG